MKKILLTQIGRRELISQRNIYDNQNDITKNSENSIPHQIFKKEDTLLIIFAGKKSKRLFDNISDKNNPTNLKLINHT